MKRPLLAILFSAWLLLVAGLSGVSGRAGLLHPEIALGQSAPSSLSPEEMDALARRLEQELRCPVCEGQSVAESHSRVAVEMRDEIRQMLEAGRTPEEILDHYVDEYGVWILNSPPRSGWFLLAWLAPAGALLIGAGIALSYARRRRPPAAETGPEGDANFPPASPDRQDWIERRLKELL